jgi:hypothetical protein
MSSYMLAMLSIVLKHTEKPADALLVVILLLTFQNDLFGRLTTFGSARDGNQPYLFAAVQKLITTIFRKIIFHKNLASVFDRFARDVLMLLRDAVGQAVLFDLFENRKA